MPTMPNIMSPGAQVALTMGIPAAASLGALYLMTPKYIKRQIGEEIRDPRLYSNLRGAVSLEDRDERVRAHRHLGKGDGSILGAMSTGFGRKEAEMQKQTIKVAYYNSKLAALPALGRAAASLGKTMMVNPKATATVAGGVLGAGSGAIAGAGAGGPGNRLGGAVAGGVAGGALGAGAGRLAATSRTTTRAIQQAGRGIRQEVGAAGAGARRAAAAAPAAPPPAVKAPPANPQPGALPFGSAPAPAQPGKMPFGQGIEAQIADSERVLRRHGG